MNRYLLMLLDIILLFISLISALFLVNQNLYVLSMPLLIYSVFLILLVKLFVYWLFNMYSSIWEYASIQEVLEVTAATTAASTAALFVIMPFIDVFWLKAVFVDWLLNLILIGGSRLSLRIIFARFEKKKCGNLRPVSTLVYGAGKVGSSIIKELINHPGYNPVGIVDDDRHKKGTKIHGVPVLGNITLLKEIIHERDIQELVIAIPSLNKDRLRETLSSCRSMGCRVKILPGVEDLISGRASIRQARKVSIEDLLGREPVNLNIDEISGYIKDQVVLVTGGGGSIGSELCRQLARFKPQQLVILDICENDPYLLQQELAFKHPNLNTRFIIGSITDRPWVGKVFASFKPDVVFHAAAHKHVPLMEENPHEAVKNNVFGTINVAESASSVRTKAFVLISTDKAVNPENVMGATKRLSEIFIQCINKNSVYTRFTAVRFGNVLGSKGSVIPLFEKQIEWSNTIRITHPEATRYFMTIPEAVQLVIQAGSMAKGGEVFVLDMGKPVKILDLSKDLIRLMNINEEVKTVFTGLRPGEKIHEELFTQNCLLSKTPHRKIFVEQTGIDIDMAELHTQLENLKTACLNNSDDLLKILQKIIPAFKPQY